MTATSLPEPADDLYGEDPYDPADEPCTYPVWNPSRFPAWPHMGPCGHPEPHTHD